jgi:hypothetical protein
LSKEFFEHSIDDFLVFWRGIFMSTEVAGGEWRAISGEKFAAGLNIVENKLLEHGAHAPQGSIT